MASKLATYTCPSDALAFGRDAPGTLHRVEPDDWERLQTVDEVIGRDRDLVHCRDEQWWRERVFRTIGGDDRYVYALERDGDVHGYVAYTVESGDDGRRLVSYYSGAADHAAYRGLLGFLSNHDSQVDEVELCRHAGDSLLDAVPEPDAVECEVHSGAMVRAVDIVDALETVPYPEGCTETLALDVDDDTADWNDDQFELAVSDGRGECHRVTESDPDATLAVGTLTQVLVGHHSVADARRFGDLAVANEDIASRLSTVFPPRTVGSLDNF